jgi:hypothetical protein
VLEPDPELAVAYGLFSVRQARAAGYSRADIERQVRRGTWNRRERGVLECSGRASHPHDHLLLAVLTTGPQAVIGFAGAGDLHGWALGSLPWTPTLVVPPAGRSKSRAAAAFRTTLARDEVALLGVLPVTSPLCTAVHLAEFLPLAAGVISLDCAFRSRQITQHQVDSALAVRHGHGIVGARHALELSDALSGSVIESEARLLFHEAGLPPPVTQHGVQAGILTFFLDFAWPGFMLFVEIDGREFHIGREPFQRDRTKQNALVRRGWRVLRYTVEDIRLRPAEVLADIRSFLDR